MHNTRLELYYSTRPFLVQNTNKSKNRFKMFDMRAHYFFKLRDKGILSEQDFKGLTKRLTGVEFDLKPLTDELFQQYEGGKVTI